MANFSILKDFVKHVKRFNLKGRTVEFKINSIPEDKEPVAWVRNAIEDIILHATSSVDPSDLVGFTFCSKDFKQGQGWKKFQKASEVTVDDVWGLISSIYQSNSSGLNTDTFCLGITTVKLPSGTGNNRANKYNTFSEECAMRKGIVTINNNDNLCLPRALVVALAYVQRDPAYKKVCKDTGKMQTERALKLIEDAALSIPEEGAGIPELQQIQKFLSDKYRMCVYQYGSKGRDIIFEGANGSCTLNLLYHNGHYNVITSLTAAFCCSYYCEKCHVPYDNKNKHRCGGTCQACNQSPACQPGIKIKCTNCNRWFKNTKCYDYHTSPNSFGKKTVCSQIICCDTCLKTIRYGRTHFCGEVFCKICKKHQTQDHLCYMQPDTKSPLLENFLFVFYDLETKQEKVIDENTVEHEPNLCVFKQCCDKCISSNAAICEKCGVRLQILKINVIEGFMLYLLQARKVFKNIVVIAHNGQSFDHQFILNYILTKTDLIPELIMRGTKIISMTLGNIKFLDSLNYFPMALSKLPKAFGLDANLNKGYFPHLFNTAENINYVGTLPDKAYYCSNTMKDSDRNVFMSWYEEHKHDEFDFQRDLVAYCISDVEILTQACLTFRKQLLSTGNVCPFTEACTIAGACNKVYRRNFLKPNTVGIIPKGGYRCRDNQSKIATQWMIWEEYIRGIIILHSAYQKEVRLGGLKVDGYCEETKQVFEFHGCYYHGHPDCQKFNRDTPLHDNLSETLNLRYESTQARVERLRKLGYEVIEMWECEFARQLLLNKDMKTYTENHELITGTPLNPRDAFYGGRTGNTKKYYKIKNGEKINYIDICSLYPYVCKTGKYPTGHPNVIVNDICSEEFSNLNGVIKCTILPPQNLYHPVLPAKINNKLMFSLCNACAIASSSSEECIHTENQRAITGTWVIEEVIKAIQKGYLLLKVHEFWEYTVEQYDEKSKLGGLFTEMMNKFLKIKQQASGWPANCITIEQKEAYIEDFLNKEGIQLEIEEIVENPGLRALAKLILNSFWGKLGQRENQPKTKIVNRPDEFFAMMTDSTIVVNAVLPVNEHTVIVNYENSEETYDVLQTVNVCLAAYTTTQARLKLYYYLEILGDRVLYYDTDSVIYVSRPGEVDPPLGFYVGDMMNELSNFGPGSYITEFVSGGPKNYAYIVYSPGSNKYHEVCKVKGICVNHEVGKDVNFGTLKDMIINDAPPKKITYRSIRRTALHEVVTKNEEKIFNVTSSKRKFEGYDSVPFGYKTVKTE